MEGSGRRKSRRPRRHARWIVRGGKGLDHWAKRYGEVIRRLPEGGRVPGGWAALVVGMPHDLAFDQIDHFFGDIGGMIADAFQMA